MSDGPIARGRAGPPREAHRRERHRRNISTRLNWLRAGVLGANDGIISTAGLVVGVAAATTSTTAIATAGLAGLVAGATSMALGEYVSVSSQRDTEQALVRQERDELEQLPVAEHRELVQMLEARGLSEQTAQRAAEELAAHDELGAHLELELGLDRTNMTSPVAAAGSSAVAFTVGALVPLVAILLAPEGARIIVAAVAVLVALVVTGVVSARLGQHGTVRAVARLVAGGALALVVTYLVGELLGAAI
ncbi:MAG TPA: VIT family protein [Microthrixaceae bacterium]|nr:VIT family protein [Microthrixaceae bacterium]